MVHEVGHGLHFSESAADMAFVTKNALTIRDAQAKESQTAPFKSIQSPSIEKLNAEDSKTKQNGSMSTARSKVQIPGNMANHGPNSNFSFNSSCVAKSINEAESYDYDSNFEKDSTASFDFNGASAHRTALTVVGPLAKPTPSKWNDAEKWLSAGEAQTRPRPKNSPLSATAQNGLTTLSRKKDIFSNVGVGGLDESNDKALNLETTMANPCADGSSSSGENSCDGEYTSSEKCNKFLVDCKKNVDSSKKGLPRFSFMTTGKPVPLPLPMAEVDRYPLEDVYGRNDSNAKENSTDSEAANGTYIKSALRAVNPSAGVPAEPFGKSTGDINEQNDSSPPVTTTDAIVYAEPAVVNMRTVCMRDMGTAMTPIASVEPSRTATPLMATTPNLGSPAISRPSSPGKPRPDLTPMPASSTSKDYRAGTMTTDAKAVLTGKDKTRAEILALGTQLGKANIAAWATKEEEEADAAQALKASLEMEEVRKNLLASRAAAWEEAEQAKYMARFKREEAKIQAWENHEKAKAEAEMRRVEVKVERMRSHANEKLMNKLAVARRRAEDLRAKAEALRCEQAAKTANRAEDIRRTGKIPTLSFAHLCG